jgi:cytochrome bd-type quinol oxidase subunit 1
MKQTILVGCPVFLGTVALVAALLFERKGTDRRFARIVFWVSLLALVLYVAGIVVSKIGDMTYHGSNEPFSWSPVYWVTIPMIASGAMLAFTACVVVIIEAGLYAIFREEKCGESDIEGDGRRQQ